jgi:hypothetical protein
VREEVARDPRPHEGNGKIIEVANPLNFPRVRGVKGLNACRGRLGWFYGKNVSAQALAVCGSLFIQTARTLNVPAEDRCCGYYASAAALASDQAEVRKAGQGLTHDAAGDAKLPLQFLFGGQGGAWRECEVHDLPVQDVPDLCMKRASGFPVQTTAASGRLRCCFCWFQTHANSSAAMQILALALTA